MYTITYSPKAQEGLAKLKHSEPASFKKAVKLLNEIAVPFYQEVKHLLFQMRREATDNAHPFATHLRCPVIASQHHICWYGARCQECRFG